MEMNEYHGSDLAQRLFSTNYSKSALTSIQLILAAGGGVSEVDSNYRWLIFAAPHDWHDRHQQQNPHEKAVRHKKRSWKVGPPESLNPSRVALQKHLAG